jgi:NAD(P)-dependent dehydrogenase (short-subunit alcohol dehydrogenase family)
VSAARVVIITGGTFGIGRAITLRLAALGHAVVAFGLEAPQVSSIAAAGIAELTAELTARGLHADLMEADVSRAADVSRVVDATLARHGRIDALVNNAAIGPLGTVLDTDEALFDRIVAVNLKGPYLCSRAVLPHMIRAGGGTIINIGSGAGWGKPNMAAYSASKGGVFALSASMAYDFLHQRIRVNTVVPGGGGIVSGMSLGRVGGDPSRLGPGAPGTAAGRPATGDDIANAIAFLISPEAEAISGTVIDVGCFAHQGGPVPPKRASQGGTHER